MSNKKHEKIPLDQSAIPFRWLHHLAL